MPMQSQAQRAYLWIHHPEIAREFEDKTPKGKKLPKHKKSTQEKKSSCAPTSAPFTVSQAALSPARPAPLPSLDGAGSFRFGFMSGLSESYQKRAFGFSDVLSTLAGGAGIAGGLLLAAPPVTGAVAGYGLAKLREGNIKPEDVRKQELIAEYRRLADEARNRRELSRGGDLMRIE